MKHFRFTVYTHRDGQEVILFQRCRYCTEDVADKYVDKLLTRFDRQCIGAGWEIIP